MSSVFSLSFSPDRSLIEHNGKNKTNTGTEKKVCSYQYAYWEKELWVNHQFWSYKSAFWLFAVQHWFESVLIQCDSVSFNHKPSVGRRVSDTIKRRQYQNLPVFNQIRLNKKYGANNRCTSSWRRGSSGNFLNYIF